MGYVTKSLLILPAAGIRNNTTGALSNNGTNGYYWSSLQNGTNNAYNLNFNNSGTPNVNNMNNRTNGMSVRCIEELNKNEEERIQTRLG